MESTIRATFVGDTMCKMATLGAFSIEGGYDFSQMFERMRPYFADSDLVVANLETPISASGKGLTSGKYSFCSPVEFAAALKECGVDAVSTANNHCLDRGVSGIASTVAALDSVCLKHTGVFSAPACRVPLVIDVGGMRIAIMSYTYGTNAFDNGCYLPKDEFWRVNLFQDQELSNPFTRFRHKRGRMLPIKALNKALSLISENERRPVYERRERSREKRQTLLKDIERVRAAGVDLIVMCMHAGGQYNLDATSSTRALAKWLLDQGVDVVAGTHEHLVHGGEFSREDGRVATYSLGNFCCADGVLEEPFDKMCEYSVAWNLYLDPSQTGPEAISEMGFSVLKSVPLKGTEGGIQVVPAADLFAEEDDSDAKARLLDDVRVIAKRFSGKDVTGDAVEREYEVKGGGPAGA